MTGALYEAKTALSISLPLSQEGVNASHETTRFRKKKRHHRITTGLITKYPKFNRESFINAQEGKLSELITLNSNAYKR